MKIKEIVKDGKLASFTEYRDGNLWYKVGWWEQGVRFNEFKEFEFPIPIEDATGAKFPSEIKAITLMRWIRKHKELLDKGGDSE